MSWLSGIRRTKQVTAAAQPQPMPARFPAIGEVFLDERGRRMAFQSIDDSDDREDPRLTFVAENGSQRQISWSGMLRLFSRMPDPFADDLAYARRLFVDGTISQEEMEARIEQIHDTASLMGVDASQL